MYTQRPLFLLFVLLVPFVAAAQGNGSLEVLFVQKNPTCANVPNGRIEATRLGGDWPVRFVWINTQASLSGLGEWNAPANAVLVLNDLPAGEYFFAFTDADGDTLTRTLVLTAPPPIEVDLAAKAESCFGQNGGFIEITDISGGQAPYRAGLDGETPGSQRSWSGLPGGTYLVTILDALGCAQLEGVVLPDAPGLLFEAGSDTSVFDGDTLRLEFSADRPIDSVAVAPAEGVQTVGDSWVVFAPERSTLYTVFVYATDGCGAADALYIEVFRKRNVYFPNVFSPDDPDVVNQKFTVFSGKGVQAVSWLRVYNRLGKTVFEATNVPANDPAAGWDGRCGGNDCPPGVYLWEAALRFTDGREKVFLGDVTLVR